MRKIALISILVLAVTGVLAQRSSFTKPSEFFGFEPGSDRNLFTYEQLIEYLGMLDAKRERAVCVLWFQSTVQGLHPGLF